MNDQITVSAKFNRYLQSPQSLEARAFFEGARSMMTALQLAPASDYPSMLSTSNQQHIIALLVQSDEQQRARRQHDVQQLLRLYDYDKLKLLAFIFDLQKINQNGQAVDETSEPLEDDMFRPLPGKTQPGWPDYKIEHHHNDEYITRDKYLALSEEDQQDYTHHRYFHLRLAGEQALRICSSDYYLMAELIRQTILIGDPGINRRYLTEIYCSAETESVGKLYEYRDVIISAINELSCTASSRGEITPMLTAQAHKGYIMSMGHYLIAQFQELCMGANLDRLLQTDAITINQWTEIINACLHDDDSALSKFITDADFATYYDVNGNPMPSAAEFTADGETGWETVPYSEDTSTAGQKCYFKHILISRKLYQRLDSVLSRNISRTDPLLLEAKPSTINALKNLMYCLSDGSFILTF